ncbi:hypothetical protein KC19_10G037100 [Ceratodon purpureus]|uniref:Uncharacterized protein n=1 Tax=Ceratodon purpureus TaxID=3225 RepID=A0A8T0GJZ2_CERPU|nr:hypothetical protein KC19_10G037100 [Ceratodon purpureus]
MGRLIEIFSRQHDVREFLWEEGRIGLAGDSSFRW